MAVAAIVELGLFASFWREMSGDSAWIPTLFALPPVLATCGHARRIRLGPAVAWRGIAGLSVTTALWPTMSLGAGYLGHPPLGALLVTPTVAHGWPMRLGPAALRRVSGGRAPMTAEV